MNSQKISIILKVNNEWFHFFLFIEDGHCRIDIPYPEFNLTLRSKILREMKEGVRLHFQRNEAAVEIECDLFDTPLTILTREKQNIVELGVHVTDRLKVEGELK